MSDIDWQTAVALLCVLLAATILVRRAVRLFRNDSPVGCGAGGCSDCPSSSPAAEASKTLVSLETFQPPGPVS